jgi:hypothetical protein
MGGRLVADGGQWKKLMTGHIGHPSCTHRAPLCTIEHTSASIGHPSGTHRVPSAIHSDWPSISCCVRFTRHTSLKWPSSRADTCGHPLMFMLNTIVNELFMEANGGLSNWRIRSAGVCQPPEWAAAGAPARLGLEYIRHVNITPHCPAS